MASGGARTRRGRRSFSWRSALLASLLAGAPAAARGDGAPAARPDRAPGQHRHVGLGWKLGNGLGELGGELVLAPAPPVAIELHLGFPRLEVDAATRTSDARGWGVAPTIRLYPITGGTAFHLAAGVHHSRWTFHALRWSRTALFVNGGVEWRWQSGLRILAGLGARYASAVDETSATEWVRADAGWGGNLEAGLRYMFF